MTKETLSQVH
jgi:hypothetical protein